MKVLVHYLTFLHDLVQYGTRPPLEHVDRLWHQLRTSHLQVYISERGLNVIRNVLSSNIAHIVIGRIEDVFEVCPHPSPLQLEEAQRSFVGGDYEELVEICSARLMQIDYILSDIPCAFHSFGLREIQLDRDIVTVLRGENSSLKSFPALMKGNFSSLWFLENYLRETPDYSSKTTLSQWFRENRSARNWHPLEAFNVKSYVETTARSRKFRRGKLIHLGPPHLNNANSVILVIAVANPQREFNVTMEILPSQSNSVLPRNLLCQILDVTDTCVAQEETGYNTPAISMEIEGEAGERVSILIQHQGFIHREDLVI